MAKFPMSVSFSSSSSPDRPTLKHGAYLQGRAAAERTLADKVLI